MLSARDYQDIMLEAEATVMEVMREVVDSISSSSMMRDLRMMWSLMPPEIKEQFKLDEPEIYEELQAELSKEI